MIPFAHVAAHTRHSRVAAAPSRPRGGDGLARVQAISATIEPPEPGRSSAYYARDPAAFRPAHAAPVALLMIVLGAVLGGTKGLLGAALGVALVIAFFGISVLVVGRAAKVSPQAMMAAAVGTFLVKILVSDQSLIRYLPELDPPFNGRFFGADRHRLRAGLQRGADDVVDAAEDAVRRAGQRPVTRGARPDRRAGDHGPWPLHPARACAGRAGARLNGRGAPGAAGSVAGRPGSVAGARRARAGRSSVLHDRRHGPVRLRGLAGRPLDRLGRSLFPIGMLVGLASAIATLSSSGSPDRDRIDLPPGRVRAACRKEPTVSDVSVMTTASGCHLFGGCGCPAPSISDFYFKPIFTVGGHRSSPKPIVLAVVTAVIILTFFYVAFRKPKLVPRRHAESRRARACCSSGTRSCGSSWAGRADKYLPFIVAIFFFVWMHERVQPHPADPVPGDVQSSHSRSRSPSSCGSPTSRSGSRARGRSDTSSRMARARRGALVDPAAAPGPVELFSNILVRPFTLAIRLFANMLAGHLLLLVFGLASWYLFSLLDRPALRGDVVPADDHPDRPRGADHGAQAFIFATLTSFSHRRRDGDITHNRPTPDPGGGDIAARRGS